MESTEYLQGYIDGMKDSADSVLAVIEKMQRKKAANKPIWDKIKESIEYCPPQTEKVLLDNPETKRNL